MKLSQFKFKLSEDRIAQYPTPFRDDCRLMVIHAKSNVIEHRESFRDILDFFDDKDVFVFNDTKVFPARLYGNKEKTGAKIEVFLLRELNKDMRLWDVLVDPARKIRIGNKLYFGEDESLVAEVIDNTTSRGRTLRFLYDGSHEEFKRTLFGMGEAPIPKEILRRGSEPEDLENFQCIFARKEGAVTAPTAGLHFSPQLMKMMEIKGLEFAYVTMHCGLGNFREIDVEDLTKNKMESEQINLPESMVNAVNKAHEEQKRVCAVGTEIMRAMEHVAGANGLLKAYDGWTNKFIFPPYTFATANSFFVNFYLPCSSQQIMVAAFAGYENLMHAYEVAVQEEYRFGDYGDAMLIVD